MALQINQFHPTVAFGDAISNQILSLQQLLRGLGYHSEIFCEQPPINFKGKTKLIAHYELGAAAEHLLLTHFSLGYSLTTLEWLRRLPARKVLVYHNITPHAYFSGINEIYLEAAQAGREQLPTLQPLTVAGWGDSDFNCQELAEQGWSRLGTLPIIFEPRRYAVTPDRRVLKRLQDGRLNLLFVGRVSPNKRLEDLILTFYYLKHNVNPDARLLLVGSARGMEPYLGFLQALIKRLQLTDVIITGHITTAELVAYYQSATVYLSMSEHEGFGVPLLESMYFGVPIIAYKAAAVPETLAGSGILVKTKDHAAIAELIGLVAEDVHLRTRVVSAQKMRLKDFMPEKISFQLQKLLQALES